MTLAVLRRGPVARLVLRRGRILWCAAVLIVLVLVIVSGATVGWIVAVLSRRWVRCRAVARAAVPSLLAIVPLLRWILTRGASVLLPGCLVLIVSAATVLVVLVLRRGWRAVIWLLASISSLLVMLALAVCAWWRGRVCVMAWGAVVLARGLVGGWGCCAGVSPT